LGPGAANGEFFLILGPGSKVEDVKFITGSDQVKDTGKAISSIAFNFRFPDGGPTRLVRRGVLDCEKSGPCTFVLINPDDVHSVN
jgi:hypothetical protein